MQSRIRPRLDRLLYFLDRVLSRLSSEACRLFSYYIVAQPITRRELLPARRGASIQVREVLQGDTLLAAFGRRAEVLQQRFAQGAHCIAALRGGELLGYLWFTTGGYEEDEVHCRFVPLPERKRAWDFDVYIRPEHRASLVFPKLWAAASERMSELGAEQTLSRISAHKPASLQAHARLGARVIARCLFLKLGNLQLMVSTARPRFALSLGSSSRPVLLLPS
jgi:hypothetical protein